MIGIFGDSFADINPSHLTDEANGIMPWPMHLENIADEKVITHGKTATSTYWSYKNFLTYHAFYDKIIFVYSEYNRWHTLKDQYERLAYLTEAERLDLLDPEFKEAGEALMKVKPFIFDEEFNKFIYQSIFDRVNKICKRSGKLLVNIMPFELNYTEKELPIDISEAAGPCLTNILEISLEESRRSKALDKHIRTMPDLRHNHLNSHNTKVLAEIVQESFLSSEGLLKLAKDSRFKYDDAYIQHIIKYMENQ